MCNEKRNIMEKKIIGIGAAILLCVALNAPPSKTNTSATKPQKATPVAEKYISTKMTKQTVQKVSHKKEEIIDTSAPVITVSDGQITRGSTYQETNYYSVKDDVTKSCDVSIEGGVDTNVEGDYTITVTAKDEAGNQSIQTYTISVVAPTCDGTNVTEGCVLDGVRYNKYIYHPAVEERSHMEQRSSSQQVITGYCTLCNDGTYSPSCATGRGACSHHGGVQQWNAPIYGTSTSTWEEKVVDVAPQDAWMETEVAQ